MINKATDAVSKMTIKMNESDAVSSPDTRTMHTTACYKQTEHVDRVTNRMSHKKAVIVCFFMLKWYLAVILLQWFEEKLQEVESSDQQFRKLHTLVESLVVHRKGSFFFFENQRSRIEYFIG